MTAGKLTGLDQSGPKLASIICRGIEQAKDVQLGELLFACGIYGVEEEEAWLLAKRFSNLEALYGASIDSLMSYNLLNEAVAVNTYNFFRTNRRWIEGAPWIELTPRLCPAFYLCNVADDS